MLVESNDVLPVEQKEENDESIHLTKLLLDKHSTLLEDHEIDIDLFQELDLEEQYEVIDQLQRLRRDTVREKMNEVHEREDLLAFSNMQMSNFINAIKEKTRQREIMAQAS